MIIYLTIIISIIISYLTYFIFQLLNVDFKSKNNGGNLVAQVLKSHGVKFVFTLTGGHISPILVGCKKLGIKVIDVRNEATAAFAADGISRLSNEIGVAIVTAGPGVTNTITAVRNAQLAESPLLLIGGAAANLLKGRGSLQDVEQLELLKPICKKVYSCTKVNQIVDTVKNAIHVAKSGVPGPVFLELPIDLLYNIETICNNSGLQKKKNSLFGKIADIYISLSIRHMFSNAWSKKNFNPIKINRPKINKYKIDYARKLIRKSSKPIVVIGSQCMNEYNNIKGFVHNFKLLELPVYLSSAARGLFSDEYELQFYHKRTISLRNADLIILLGVTCDFRLDYGRVLNKKANIISVNLNYQSLKLNQPLFWKPTLEIHGDPVEFINSLKISYIPNSKVQYHDWIDELKKKEKKREEEIVKMSNQETKKINPIKLCLKLNKIIKKNTIIIVDGGDFAATASYTIKPKGPLKWMDPGPFGTLGVGAGFALAAKLCNPDDDVLIIYGDGSAGYSLVEYDTFKRHNLKIISVIGNDACWTQILREQITLLEDDVACNLEYSSYEKIGQCFGANGLEIQNDTDLNTLKEIYNNADQALIINSLISKTDFRKGSISV